MAMTSICSYQMRDARRWARAEEVVPVEADDYDCVARVTGSRSVTEDRSVCEGKQSLRG